VPKESAYLDACVWIAQYKPKETQTAEQRDGISALFREIEHGSIVAVASSIVLVEVLTVTAEELEQVLDGRKGMLVAADDAICRRARQLQQSCYKDLKKVLSCLDSIHLATAWVMGCKRFVTMDGKKKNNQLAPLDSQDYLEKLTGLKIIEPSALNDQKRLDFEDVTA
jgi:predicted nucleic acid-binding protein